MRSWSLAAVGVVAAFEPARAEPAKDVTKLFEQLMSQDLAAPKVRLPRLAITIEAIDDAPSDMDTLRFGNGVPGASRVTKPVVGVSADGKTAWLAADLAIVHACPAPPKDDDTGDAAHYRPDYCTKGDPKAWYHATALFERASEGWHPVIWHVAGRRPGGLVQNRTELTRKIEPGAEPVAKLFEDTMGDPASLRASISERADVVLFGSEKAERFDSGVRARRAVMRWNLAFTATSVRAGLTASKDVAWVAALVTTSQPKPETYRVTFVYAREGSTWRVVQAFFSSPPPGYDSA